MGAGTNKDRASWLADGGSGGRVASDEGTTTGVSDSKETAVLESEEAKASTSPEANEERLFAVRRGIEEKTCCC